MKPNDARLQHLPIVCAPFALTSTERARATQLRAALSGAVERASRTEDGLSFEFSNDDPGPFAAAAEWVALERRCCPFLGFRLSWAPGPEGATLEVFGPPGTHEFLRDEMPELPREG